MLDPHLRLEPLAVAVDQGDRRHRNAADAGRDADQIVEALLRRAVQDVEAVQRVQARFLVVGLRRRAHAVTG